MKSFTKILLLTITILFASTNLIPASAQTIERVILSCMPTLGEKYLVSIIKNFETKTFQIMISSRVRTDKQEAEKKQSDRTGGETQYVAHVPGGQWVLSINSTIPPTLAGRPAQLSSQIYGQVSNTGLMCESF